MSPHSGTQAITPDSRVPAGFHGLPPASQFRHRESRPALVCRTCVRCRTKKIRCDGNQTGCSNCGISGHECRFPVDGRRESARTTKAEVRALQDELASVKTLLQDARSPEGPRRTLTQSGEEDIKPVPGLHKEPSIVRVGSETHVLSASEVRLAGQITETGELQVHGITSTLHRPAASDDYNAGYNDAQNDVQTKQDEEIARAQLISNAAIQKQKESSLMRYPGIKIDLDGVPPELAFYLLDIHWNSQHYSFLLSYRPAIIDSILDNGPYSNRMLLNAIYYSSCLHSNRPDLRLDSADPKSNGLRLYDRFKQLLPDYIDEATVPSAVALLLCGASLVSYGRQSAGWILCGIAYRHVLDIGCHLSIQGQRRNVAPQTVILEQEMKNRLYWGAYMTDKFQSLYLGRPPVLLAAHGRVPKQYLDTFEELEEWKPAKATEMPDYTPRPSYATSTALALNGVAEIIEQIIEVFYSIGSIKIHPEYLLRSRADLHSKLLCWVEELPPHLHFNPESDSCPPPHQVTPHAMYWTTHILLERPFLSTGHLGFVVDEQARRLSEQRCEEAAVRMWHLLRAYKETFTLRHAPYLISYSAYSAALVIIQSTHQEPFRYPEAIPFFWSALMDLQKGCNFGLQKPLKILKSLMNRMEPEALPREASQVPSSAQTPGIDPNLWPNATLDDTGTHVLGDLEGWNQAQWLDTIVTDQGMLSDSMYGLFTPNDMGNRGF